MAIRIDLRAYLVYCNRYTRFVQLQKGESEMKRYYVTYLAKGFDYGSFILESDESKETIINLCIENLESDGITNPIILNIIELEAKNAK